MEPQWDDMRVFLAVAREESLSGAGKVLKMDPATVGRRIARLEEAMEAPLFVKSPQGYALSAAGERLLSFGVAGSLPECSQYPLPHFGRGFSRERQGQNVRRRDAGAE